MDLGYDFQGSHSTKFPKNNTLKNAFHLNRLNLPFYLLKT
jgi:hypothetical protein